MNGQQEYRMGVGASSILMIFVLLSLTTLAVLSFASARADLTLTKRRQTQVEAYYTAVAEAQRVIAGIDGELLGAPKEPEAYTAYVLALKRDGIKVTDDLILSFVVPISDAQELRVSLQATGPEGRRYQVIRHDAVNIAEWIPDDSFGWD